MARDKLSNFLWFKFLVNFFLPTKFARTTNMKIACDPEAEAASHRCRPYTKPSGWDTTLSKTHDMPKKSRATREQLDELFAILAEHTEFVELMCIYITSTRARKPSIIPKLVRLSQGNHGINWTRTPWSRLDGGVYNFPGFFLVQHQQDSVIHA